MLYFWKGDEIQNCLLGRVMVHPPFDQRLMLIAHQERFMRIYISFGKLELLTKKIPSTSNWHASLPTSFQHKAANE